MNDTIATKHVLTVQKVYYNAIVDGTKSVEGRLYDEKRQLIKGGDIIEFVNKDNTKETCIKKVNYILIYDNIDNKYNALMLMLCNTKLDILLPGINHINEAYGIYTGIYKLEDIKKYGMIAIYLC